MISTCKAQDASRCAVPTWARSIRESICQPKDCADLEREPLWWERPLLDPRPRDRVGSQTVRQSSEQRRRRGGKKNKAGGCDTAGLAEALPVRDQSSGGDG